MADQRDPYDIERVVSVIFEAEIADGHQTRGGRSLKAHSAEANLQANSPTLGLWAMYPWLDRAPKGRNETGVWWCRHDEYDDKRAA
jgi:predicted dithiol-disulfide oxidoreductase (DUF899 family)